MISLASALDEINTLQMETIVIDFDEEIFRFQGNETPVYDKKMSNAPGIQRSVEKQEIGKLYTKRI